MPLSTTSDGNCMIHPLHDWSSHSTTETLPSQFTYKYTIFIVQLQELEYCFDIH